MRIRTMTYNIHKGIGGIDRRYRIDRIIDTIRNYDPDILLLQEVDNGVPRSRHERQVDVIGEALGLAHRAYQENVKLQMGCYGNAILSRYPLSGIHDVELKIPFKKRRRALGAHCQVHWGEHSRTVLVYNLHLGLAGYERKIQLRKFLANEVLQHVNQTTAVIAAGDFNDVWGTLGKATLEPAGFKSATHRVRTFPAFMPIRPLDRIYYRGKLDLLHGFAAHRRIAMQASDHLPLLAEFRLH